MLFRRFLPLAALLAVMLTRPVAADEPVKKADDGERRASRSIAHIKLSGGLDETPVAPDPILGTAPENFNAKLERIRKAKKDNSVHGLYLYLDGLDVGFGKIDELTRAVEDFRRSGKKAVAYLEAGEAKDYLVALACDEIHVPEVGWLMLTGLRMEVVFFKDLLAKLEIKADLMQMGAFKGAAEPFTRSTMSPELRQQLESVLDDHFEKDMVARIVAGRKKQKWTADQVKKLIDQGPFTPKAALKEGLIDGVVHPEMLPAKLKGTFNCEVVRVVKDYGKAKSESLDLSNPFDLLKLLKPSTPKASKNPKVAVIHASGVIVSGKGGKGLLSGQSIGSTTFVEAIREAEEDETVRAIVLRVDSPGGSALASDLIWEELTRCKKPVVASMSDVAASGGYYISMGARKIYAEPGTLTGSIGVVSGKLALGGLFEMAGVKTEVLKRGQNAEILSGDRPFSASERTAMKAMMEDVYDQFTSKALKGRARAGRKMTRDDLEKLAGGRIWTGRQAKENGLIDELGTLKDAVADAWKMADMPADKEPEILVLPKPKSMLDTFMEDFLETKSPLSRLRQSPALREVTERLGSVEGFLQLRHEPAWLVVPYSVKVR